MSGKFVCVLGLKATCSGCDKTFSPDEKQQFKLFSLEPLPCPSCKSIQVLSNEQRDVLKEKGNPGRPYRLAIGMMGVCNLVFFGSVLAGYINHEAFILCGFVLAIAGQFAVSQMFNAATADLYVRLNIAPDLGEV